MNTERNLDRILKNASFAPGKPAGEMPLAVQAGVLAAWRSRTSQEETLALVPLLWKSLATVCAITSAVVVLTIAQTVSDPPDEIESASSALNVAWNQ